MLKFVDLKTLRALTVLLVSGALFIVCLSKNTHASLPEPKLSIYGKVFVDNDNDSERLSTGQLKWQVQRVNGEQDSTEYTVNIEPFANNEFDYRLDIPLKLLVGTNPADVFTLPAQVPGTLAFDQSGSDFELTSVAIDGKELAFLNTEASTLSVNQQKRSQQIRLDLLVLGEVSDSDSDGMDDEWEIAVFGSIEANANEDADADGLTNLEEFIAGTSAVLFDTDGDQYSDFDEIQAGSDPLDINSIIDLAVLRSAQLFTFSDLNADGVSDYGLFGYVPKLLSPQLRLINGDLDGESLGNVSWPARYDVNTIELVKIPNVTGDGLEEVGVFGMLNEAGIEGRWQLHVRNILSNSIVSVYNWPAKWASPTLTLLSDLTGDGIGEIALQGVMSDNGRPQMMIKDGQAPAIKVATFSYPDFMHSPLFLQLSDLNDDKIDDIGMFGVLKSNDKPQIRISSGSLAQQRLGAYNFPAKWTDVHIEELHDYDDDGEGDLGLFGVLRTDGRYQLVVRSGANSRSVIGIYSWPNDFVNGTFVSLPDVNGDNINDFAVHGLRGNSYQLMVKDGRNRSARIGNYNWPSGSEYLSVHVIDDISGDNTPDIGMFAINSQTGEYSFTVKSGNANDSGVVATFNFGSDWTNAKLIPSQDINLDGKVDIAFYGQKISDSSLILSIYSGASPTEIIQSYEWNDK